MEGRPSIIELSFQECVHLASDHSCMAHHTGGCHGAAHNTQGRPRGAQSVEKSLRKNEQVILQGNDKHQRAKGAASKVLGRLTDTSGNSLNGMAYQADMHACSSAFNESEYSWTPCLHDARGSPSNSYCVSVHASYEAWMVVLTEAKAEKDIELLYIEVAAAAERERLKEFAAHNKETSRLAFDLYMREELAVCKSVIAFVPRNRRKVLDRMSASSAAGLQLVCFSAWRTAQDCTRDLLQTDFCLQCTPGAALNRFGSGTQWHRMHRISFPPRFLDGGWYVVISPSPARMSSNRLLTAS
eukprot:6036248-Amphidinium_carterae.1